MRTLRIVVVVAGLVLVCTPSAVIADAVGGDAGGRSLMPLQARGGPVDAAALVQAVRESEGWIHRVDSLRLRMESVWTSRGTDRVGAGPRARPNDSGQPRGVAPTDKGFLEYAFDRNRLRFLDDEPGRSGTLKIWDGKQFIARETQSGRREQYRLDATPQGNFDDILAGETAWPRSQPHSFWWDSEDVQGLLAFYGMPEEFKCIAREDYRGADCHVLDLQPKEVRAILHGQSYGCDSGEGDQQEHGLIGEVRGLVDQSCRWYIGVEDGRLRGICWLIAGRPRLEHWMADYRQVAPGCWLPMTQGYQIYQKDSDGRAYVESRRDLKVADIRLNEPLPDELFQLEIRAGARVQDRRSGRLVTYEYRPSPPEMLGKPLPALEQSFTQIDMKTLERKAVLICFWALDQRPSRHCVQQLAGQAERLSGRGIKVIAIHAGGIEPDTLSRWVREHDIPFPVLTLAENRDKVLFTWNVRSLPWLILADEGHIVKSQGFRLQDLDTHLATIAAPAEQYAVVSP